MWPFTVSSNAPSICIRTAFDILRDHGTKPKIRSISLSKSIRSIVTVKLARDKHVNSRVFNFVMSQNFQRVPFFFEDVSVITCRGFYDRLFDYLYDHKLDISIRVLKCISCT